jgi:hypothetical protein
MSNDPKKKSFMSIFDELNHSHCSCPNHHHNGHSYPGMDDSDEDIDFEEDEDFDASYDPEDEMPEGSLSEAFDHEILMLRDAHFSGDFDVMLDYYRKNGVGVSPDIEIDRIEYLASVEKELGGNLAAQLLTGAEAERVSKAKEAYRKIKEAYEEPSFENENAKLIMDLILSEADEPEEEISAVVNKGAAIVPALIDLVRSEEAYDPLFPGYGLAPFLAIECLGRIGDARAIIPLFECLGKEMVFDEEVILASLQALGEPAKQFLLKVLKSRPLTNDNLHAAYALLAFQDDTEVATSAFEQLQDKTLHSNSLLMNFLLADCWALKHTNQRKSFEDFAKHFEGDRELQKVMHSIVMEWAKEE